MGNVNLPTPVVFAGGALCLLGGYLLGVVAGPGSPDLTTGVVESWDSRTGTLCLTGGTVADVEGADDGVLCGEWRRSAGAAIPQVGDEFRFATDVTETAPEGEDSDRDARVLIYGDVVD